jgi:hypothetical protein
MSELVSFPRTTSFAWVRPPLEEQRKAAAWLKAHEIDGHDPLFERMDDHGLMIRWMEYGALTEHGWEIDHVVPAAPGGTETFTNLRARHWRSKKAPKRSVG